MNGACTDQQRSPDHLKTRPFMNLTLKTQDQSQNSIASFFSYRQIHLGKQQALRLLGSLLVLASGVAMVPSAMAADCPVPTSVGVKICNPTNEETVSSPVQIDASALGNAQIKAWKVYVDGIGVWSPDLYSTTIHPQLAMDPGQHRITAKAWDVNGTSYSKTIYVTVSSSGGGSGCQPSGVNRTVTICMPANGGTVKGPYVEIQSASTDSRSISAIKIYVDGVDQFNYLNPTSKQTDNQAYLAPGQHRVTVRAWDSLGAFSQTVAFTVN
jgi:Bacterial Ig domain